MKMFRPTQDGGVSGWLSADEVQLLRTLIGPMLELLTGDRGSRASSAPPSSPVATLPTREDEVFDELERMFSEGEGEETPELPEDPVLARLLPDAYADDPKAAGEFRKYTESSLREAKKYFVQTMLDTLPEGGGDFELTGDQARDWMRALNDVRLMFGVRLNVTEDFEEQLASLDPQDPVIPAFEVYGWLGGVQESLVQALFR
ncbi:MAG TPA: DUF2017 domain-containing protein [Trebonia sp.]|jgi:hypothetical protein